MAGSLAHLVEDDGSFTMELIETMGNAHEALEECFDWIAVLLGGDLATMREISRTIGAPEPEAVPRYRMSTLGPNTCTCLHPLNGDEAPIHDEGCPAAREETGVQAFDPTDPEAVCDAIIDLGARITSLEKLFEGGVRRAAVSAGDVTKLKDELLFHLFVNVAKREKDRNR